MWIIVFQELDEGEENSCWSVLFSEFERFSLETVGTFVADSELTLNLKSTNKTLHGDEWRSPATNEDYHNISRESLGLSPLPVRVTTRTITFLVGDPSKPSFPLLLGGGTTQGISIKLLVWGYFRGERSALRRQIIYTPFEEGIQMNHLQCSCDLWSVLAKAPIFEGFGCIHDGYTSQSL